MPVEIALVNPKYESNLAAVVRAAACLDAQRVWYSGSRIKFGERIPREIRLYKEIELVNEDYFITRFESLEEAQEWLEQFKEDVRLPPGTKIYKVTHNIEAV